MIWEHSSVGRASALQAEGHRFEPCCSHQPERVSVKVGPVAQLVRAPACHAGGRGFEPHPGRQLHASVAQLVEQRTENPRVVGSIPTGGTTCGFSSFGRARPCQGRGGGFEPRNPLHTQKRRDASFFFFIRKHSSVGRASALQAEGHRFEPYCFHHRVSERQFALVQISPFGREPK